VEFSPSWKNFEIPDAIHFEKYQNALEQLVLTRKSAIPRYDWDFQELKNSKCVGETMITVDDSSIIITEGFHVLHVPNNYKSHLHLINFSVFLFTNDTNLIWKRRYDNDEHKLYWSTSKDYFENVLMNSYKKFIEPTKENANLVINVDGKSVQEIVGEILQNVDGIGAS